MELTGSEILVQCLREQGVDTVFGYPGGCILNVYDALYKHSDEITHILTSHEQGASHAADGYARATGKVGVCMATSGPGATNLVTGIATAYMDSIPIIAITCNVAVSLLGRDSFQEIDIAGVTMPITKHNFIVKDVNKLADTVRRAFKIAKEGRPGPVLIDITKDVTANKAEYERKEPEQVKRITDRIKAEDIETAVKMIEASKKPYVFVGGGAIASGADAQLNEFVHKIDSPVADTLMGKGAFNGTDPLYTGMLGMHGTKASNYGVSQCDLLVVVGARFSDRVYGNAKKFAANAKILQFDVDPAEINKNIKTDASVIGDVKVILEKLNEKLPQMNHNEWITEVKSYEEAHPMTYHKGVLTMGYGLGAAIGAKMARKDKLVFNIAGDGCFRMNMNEIATATRYNIPVIEVVVNNHVLGMVRQWQDLFYGQRYSQTVLNDRVDFAKVAEGLGAKGYTVSTCEEFDNAVKEAIELNIPVVIDAQIDKDDKVFPMVAPGAPISECFGEEDVAEKFGR